MFGNAPRAVWARWLPPDDAHRVPLACRAMLVREPDGRNILCETGIGLCFPPDLRDRYGVTEDRHVLLDELAARGLGPHDIDGIVLSHLHFDHAGGLLTAWRADAPAELAFPRATIWVGADHLARARKPHPRDRASFLPELLPLLDASGRLVPIVGDTVDGLPGWRFHRSDGHTPGLLLAEVPTSSGPVVFGTDLVPGVAWVHVPITMGYDRFPERLIDEKEALFADLVARGGRIFFTHDPKVALARITRDEKGRYGVTDAVDAPADWS